MCSKLEGIFKHIGLTAMTQLSMEWHGILIPKNEKISETHEIGWHNVMPPRWCGKQFVRFDESFDTHPLQTGATH